MEIAIISGKGGTGKSSVSAAFATLDGNIVLADCDVDAANLYLLFNPSVDEEKLYVGGNKARIDYDLCTDCRLCVDFCRFDAISSAGARVDISEISCDGCFLCARICPEKAIAMVPENRSRMYSGTFRKGKMVYGRLAPGEENSGKLVNMVRDKARELSEEFHLKTVILDGPPGIGCPVISTITGVDKAVVVTEPTVSGLSDMQRALEIASRFNLATYVIINKYDLNPDMTREIESYCRNTGAEIAGRLPFAPEIVEAMVNRLSIVEYAPDHEVSQSLRKIWERLNQEPG